MNTICKYSFNALFLFIFSLPSLLNSQEQNECQFQNYYRPALFGACSNIWAPEFFDDLHCGFDCTDVGGSALLTWKSSSTEGGLYISNGTRVISYYSGGNFTINSEVTSDGELVIAGHGIYVADGWSVTAAKLVLAAVEVPSVESLWTTLLAPQATTLVTEKAFRNFNFGNLKATKSNVTMIGAGVRNYGTIVAAVGLGKSGNVSMKSGNKFEWGWNDSTWLDGYYDIGSMDLIITNGGVIAGNVIELDNRRREGISAMMNSIYLEGSLFAKTDLIMNAGIGKSQGWPPRSLGIVLGPEITLDAPQVRITNYSFVTAELSTPRTFDFSNPTDLAEFKTEFNLGEKREGRKSY